ncbi:sigma-54-dependent transcriptional regulator [Sulfitobacter geojensis]|jgi:two-component system C4-dicarboxylate transport response regulator DctD|uniref:Sigma-54-dependent Fis family transcriptional regulator n=1 Tax=Sulfitobacter geojensis TaxID=1342299 RepID=A0AAE3B5C8_9RHOB|nr:sigma-54 dependent transcriptional regulator [Sulfitobacter geojensis]KHA52135.1 C4-dicarboxylate transport transcriptional regulatory protein [Sulfitobacter geojensis]MBM1688488.1 sigma-54-dependent Fis family transcriptional regulator [Sulfitobacter geojensis]MBM1692555.1 sigma-54-dependent Fis family transcriptional regulator [Sulfitobacter geojensis]MBM1704721.1 sigma-54-dependent Fis family transcriptional regulator [Sulfitobacter geojensis]MBM1708779.1 sigma-54-dependent Fis family tr
MTGTVLLVDDDAAVREALAQTLELAEINTITAGSFVAAKDRMTAGFDGVILSDMRMPGRDGFHLLEYARAQDPDLPVILLTGEGDIPMAVAAMAQGAFGFLEKPCAPAELIAVLERALHTRALVLDNRRLRQLVETGDPAARMLFGTSDLAEALRCQARLVAQAEGDGLITGAPGSGISKVAEVIHLSSARSKAPFVKRAAAGMTSDTLRAALQEAEGGSLFIDEISYLPAQLQLVLSESPQGVCLMAGNTRDLTAEMQAGRFNADLYYRLEALSVRIPSLAERPEDIPEMFRRYVAQASEQAGLRAPEITPEVIASLMARDWPGNARSLMSVAMRFVMGVPEDVVPDTTLGLVEQMSIIERSLLETALRRTGGQASAAAAALKLPRKTFYDKLARYSIRAEDFRP